jgi:hypothetical protein
MTAPPARTRKLRTVLAFVVALLGFDLFVHACAGAWERYSPDEYAERVAGCATQHRDVVFVGGSPVAEGIDPARVGEFVWHGVPLANNYAVGLSGGTTSDVYFGTVHACPTPPTLLVYGITASDLNDSRHEPHGPHSLMTWDDLADWRRTRPEAVDWVTRHFVRGKLADLSGIARYRHGMRMWATAQADAVLPGQFPESAAEANRQRQLSADLRCGNGFVPTPWFANRQITQMRASGWEAPPFEYLARYRTGSHLKYLHRLIDWAEAAGAEVVLIDMPTTAELEQRHPAAFAEFRARLAEVERTRGVTVIRASRAATGMDDSHFADLIHMNYLGAEWFSDWLRAELTRIGAEPSGKVIVRAAAPR